MSKLKILKVNSLPSIIESNTLYFIKSDNNKLHIYLTDNEGEIVYKSYDSTDIAAVFNLLIGLITNEPGGLAGIDLVGDITLVNESIKEQTITFIATSNGEQVIDLPYKINQTSHSLLINGLKQPKTYIYDYDNDTIIIPEEFNVLIDDHIIFEFYRGKII